MWSTLIACPQFRRFVPIVEDIMAKKPPKPSLADIIRELPDEQEINEVWDEISKGNDRAAAIMGAALLEDALRYALTSRFVAVSPDDYEKLYDGPSAPLASFDSLIRVGHAVGLFGTLTRNDLLIIKKVRNGFAHAMKPISFLTPAIAAEVTKLNFVGWKRAQVAMLLIGGLSNGSPARQTYAEHVRLLIDEIMNLAFSGAATPAPKLP